MYGDGFSVEVLQGTDRLVLRVQGELDLRTVPWLRSVLDDASQYAATDVCVDFTECTYFDALTVGLLVSTARKLRRGERQLSVDGLNATQEAIVKICALHRVVTIR